MNNSYVEKTAGSVYCTLFANEFAVMAIIDSIRSIKQSSFYKQEIKQLVKQIELSIKTVESRKREVIGPLMTAFANKADAMDEMIAKDIQILRLQIKQAFDTGGVSGSDLLSHLQTASVLIQQHEIIMEICSRDVKKAMAKPVVKNGQFSVMQFNFSINYLSLNTALSRISKIFEYVTKGIKTDIDLNANPQIKRSVDVIVRKITSSEVLNKALNA